MTPTNQRTISDCTRAVLATILDRPYEDIPDIDGNKPEDYNRLFCEFLENEGYFMLSIPPLSIGESGVRFMAGKTNCLLTVKSKRFPGEQHHICGEILVEEKDKMIHWNLRVTHDPYKLDDKYEVLTIDFIIKRLQ